LIFFVGLWLGGLSFIHAGAGHGLIIHGLGVLMAVLSLNAFVLLLHEGMHNTLSGRRTVNDLLAALLGSTVGISYTAYKIMHLRHHEYLGDERDPDDYYNYTTSRRLVWLLHGVRLVAGSLLYLFLIPFHAKRHASTKDIFRMAGEYAFIFAVYASAIKLVGLYPFLVFHGLPLLIVGWLVNMRGFTQHGLAVAHDPLLASRSVHAHPVVAFLLLNENYHLEHHLFPEIPSYHLGTLHNLLWPRLPRAVKNDSYSQFLLASLKAAPSMDETPIGLVEKKNFLEDSTPT
jgi:fatty acid desaturase